MTCPADRADFHEHPDELGAITRLQADTFSLDEDRISELIACAGEDSGVKP